MESLLQTLDRTPPFWVFALARDRTNPKQKCPERFSRKEIAKRSGLALRTIDRISSRISWRDVSVGQVDDFKLGCGSDPELDVKFVRDILKREGKLILPYMTPNQMKILNRRVQMWEMSRAQQ